MSQGMKKLKIVPPFCSGLCVSSQLRYNLPGQPSLEEPHPSFEWHFFSSLGSETLYVGEQTSSFNEGSLSNEPRASRPYCKEGFLNVEGYNRNFNAQEFTKPTKEDKKEQEVARIAAKRDCSKMPPKKNTCTIIN